MVLEPKELSSSVSEIVPTKKLIEKINVWKVITKWKNPK